MSNPAAQSWGHLYDKRWEKARLVHLAAHPLCVRCASLGRVEAATIVDHSTPHKGDKVLFWKRELWQSLCKRCHDGWKQKIERRAELEASQPTCDASGYPTDGEW